MNYYKQIAEMLGVELEEEFSVKNCKTNELNISRYKMTQEGIMYSVGREKWGRSSLLMSIINGSYSVVKLPWKPKDDELYYYYSPYAGITCQQIWDNTASDYCMWKLGNCFRTKAEAQTKGKEIMEKIEKEYMES